MDGIDRAAAVAHDRLRAAGYAAAPPTVPPAWPAEPVTLAVGAGGERTHLLELTSEDEGKLTLRVWHTRSPTRTLAAEATLALAGAYPEEIADWVANIAAGALTG